MKSHQMLQIFTPLNIYTDEHLNWNGHQRCPCFSIDLSVTLPLEHLIARIQACHYKCSRV